MIMHYDLFAGISLSFYGAVAVTRILMQVVASGLERRRFIPMSHYPKATLIVPTYNEPLTIFARAMASLHQLDYPDLEIIIVDDGSDNTAEVERITNRAGFKYLYQPNTGKREAMYRGLNHARKESKAILFSDSDTVWKANAAKKLIDCLYADKQTGAVTGEVAVLNHNYSLMTRIIGMRYHMAFHYERASQSLFKTVTCVSGPLGAYRREILDDIKEDFVNQTFLGKACTYGDDRHLTNLVLIDGWKVRYAAKAKCYTQAPTKFFDLLKQQSRWGKSYWRELFWQVKALRQHGLYLYYDFVVTAILPFLLIGSVALHIAQAFLGNPNALIGLAEMLGGMSLIRVLDPMVRQRDLWYLAFVLYAFIYFLVLLPVKVFALFTMTTGHWGSRTKLASVVVEE
jgi:hyaluronan synthase